MKTIYFDYKTVPTIQDSFSLCLGYFDGVHIGHQSMINAAAKEGYKIGLLTFDVSPSYILGKFNKNIYLTSVSDKEEILSRMGVDYLFVLKFNEECMNLSYEDFLNCVILKLKPKCVFCGSDYRFGKNGSGDFNVLSKKIKTNVVPFLKINDEKVSSSAIFNFLENGDIKSANSFLGREYRVHGIVERGLQNGKKIGFPTANIKAQSYALPSDGVYQTKTIIDCVTFDSITNVGNHPTIDPLDEKIIETYILNINDIDIYGKDIYLLFIEKIRNQHQFDTINDLVNQIEKDKEFVTNKIKK